MKTVVVRGGGDTGCDPSSTYCANGLPEVIVTNTPIPGIVLPTFTFTQGPGALPTVSFAPPQTPAPRGGGPIFTPKPREQPTQTSPPTSPPKPPAPPTPLGEPPIDEPPYSTYDPEAFKQYQQSAIERFFAKIFPEGIDYLFLSKMLSGAGDVFNLLTYSQDLGPSAAEEAAQVAAFIATQPPTGLPYEDPLRNLGQQIEASATASLPNIEGLLAAYTQPSDLPEITVSGARPSPFTAASPLANPDVLPAVLLPRGLAGTQTRVGPAAGLATGTGLKPTGLVAPELRPGSLTGLGNFARPGLQPGLRPGAALSPDMSPLEGTQPGVSPTQNDCTKVERKNQQQQKKRKKRSVCYRGTYEERANGLLKWRKERIQCR